MANFSGRLTRQIPVLADFVRFVAGGISSWLRSSPRHRWLVVAGLVMVTAASVVLVSGSARSGGASSSPTATFVVVTPRPLVQRLSLVGSVEPGAVVNLLAPFDGAIVEKLVEFGTRVDKGQALLSLDTGEIEIQMREAEAAVIKAERAMADLKAWGNTPEVMRARNAVIAAQMKGEELVRKEKDSKSLLSRGIIPRVEYEGIVEQMKSEDLQLISAKQELDAALQRGDVEHRRLATLELETARKRMADLKRRMDGGLVEAPVGGLLLRPTVSSDAKGGSSPAEIEIGSRVMKGQPMFSIADTGTLRVVAHVDEIDVNRVAEGQPVEITGDAFGSSPLIGRVASISAQASTASGSSSRSASFDVIVTASAVPDDQRRRIRVGMSASLSIVTYENAAAMVVPANAVQGNIAIIRESSGQTRPVPVTVGRSTEDGVEILGGLKAGDSVVVEGGLSAAPLALAPPGLGGGPSIGGGLPGRL